MNDATARFSSRVDDYSRYRPDYPAELVPELLRMAGLSAGARIADIGSGTGIFTRRLLQRDLDVYAVEPNRPMRDAAAASLGDNPRFTSVDGSAEQTGLDEGSVDMITAAQAFHWFNNQPCREEFRRILKHNGHVAIIWNRRDTAHPMQQAYEGILREFAPDYGKLNHMNLEQDAMTLFFGENPMQQLHFDNSQRLDFNGLLGRLKSASYCPEENSASYIPLVTELLALFDHYSVDGHIDFTYETEVFMGRISR